MKRVVRHVAIFLLALLAAAASPAHAQNRALIVALGTYAEPRLASTRTQSAEAEVAAIKALLKDTHGIAPKDVKVLRDKQATRRAILEGITDWLRPDRKEVEERREKEEAIKAGKLSKKQVRALRRKWARARRKPNRSFVYFSGHGHFQHDVDGDEADSLDETLVPYDARVTADGTGSGITGMISDDEFTEALVSLEGRNVTVVLDTSHSGSATGAATESKQGESEGGFVETGFAKGSLVVWSAASAHQTALVDASGEAPRGLFTRLYAEGLGDAAADRNGNGVVSNTELLLYVASGSAASCAARKKDCPSGLTPRLDPATAHGLPAAPAKNRRRGKLSLGLLTDYLVKDNHDEIVLEQSPTSPVRVGDTDIKFTVTSPHDGTLILLSLTDAGQLIQLYPNHFADKPPASEPGRVTANSAIAVPDSGYGVKLTATDPAKGHVVAIFTRDPVDFGANVARRSPGDIPRSEALGAYLPRIAAALSSPRGAGTGRADGQMADWSVATLPFEVVP